MHTRFAFLNGTHGGARFLNLVCVVFFLMGAARVTAQEDRVSVDLQAVTMEAFVQALEAQTPYRFYYDARATDTLLLTISAERTPLEDVLRRALNPFGLYFAIDGQHRVFITDQHAIVTEPHPIQADSVVKDEFLADYIDHERPLLVSVESMLFEFGDKETATPGTRTLSGYIRDINSGEPVSLATVTVAEHGITVQANQAGYYSVAIPSGRALIEVKGVGLKSTQRNVLLYANGRLDIDMYDEVYALKEVVVSAERGSNIRRAQLGVERLSIASIKQAPTVFGEADVVKVLLTLPGVQTVGEAASGFNVRGGATDQNLVVFGDATIYNPAHFFGFFSAFNPDMVNNAELYKGSIPARFGGRLSSVLDISVREGNRNKFAGAGGIGLLTSRLSLEGPVGQKTSFIAGGRATYSDWLLRLIPDEQYKHSGASFYDANFNIHHRADDQNTLTLTGYLSNDRFTLDSMVAYGYQNRNINLKWRRVFNSGIYGMAAIGFDGYRFDIDGGHNPVDAYRMHYDIGQAFLRTDLYHRVNERHNLTYGLQVLGYRIWPGERQPLGGTSIVSPLALAREQALESALHFSDNYRVSDKLTVDIGLRYALFNVLGPGAVREYAPGAVPAESAQVGVREYGAGSFIKTYHGPEVRFGANFVLSPSSALKLGYNSLSQYIHMLSNTAAVAPTDIWKLSDTHIKPQRGGQVSLGYFQNFDNDAIETSVEAYYKHMKNYLDYRSGAVLLLNEALETDVIGTQGRAYGAEFLVKKLAGKLNGWASYTYARVEQWTVDVDPDDLINGGAYYPSSFDIPHSFTMVGNYKFSHRFSFSLNLTYRTGRPITLPVASFAYAGSQRVYYSARNQYRIPDFFRADASFTIEGSHRVKKLAHSSWTIGVYNVTGRRNPFSVYFTSEAGQIKGYKLSVYGSQIPFVTYNFRF